MESSGEVMAIDNEIKEILDIHGEKIQEHSERIAILGVELNNIKENQQDLKQGFVRLENSVLQGTNSTTQLLQQLLISKDNKEIVKNTNKTAIVVQLIIGFFSLLGLAAGIIALFVK